MERLYNPDQMSPQEIKDTFVARQGLVDRLVSLIRRQPEGAGVQHVVIVGPRGMGKTTLLLMVQFAVAEQGLTPPWQVIRFPEELYNVTDLAEFWLETLRSLAHDTSDAALSGQIEQVQARYSCNSDDLRDAALALLKDWCRTHSRRLALLVDNFHLILSQINDDRENAGLRSVLMNDGFLMLIGAAPSIFREATGYDQALYNFFKIEHLENLTSVQTQDLLRRRAAADGLAHFDQILQANRARFRVLEYFTGGNPRLVLMLYRVIAQSEVLEVRQGLEKLLDQVTPYYKDKMEILPPQQRKILDHIARESSRTHEGVTPTEIAKGTRLAANIVSSQLKRLLDAGYVRTANLRGRSTYYTLAEPLYAIWYQMRFGRDARQRMGWLVSFLKGWYDAEELIQEGKRLKGEYRKQFNAGFVDKARETLEHRRYIAEAVTDEAKQIGLLNEIISDFLELKDTSALTYEVLPHLDRESLSPDMLAALVSKGYINPTEIAGKVKRQIETAEIMGLFVANIKAKLFDEALENSRKVTELLPNYHGTWFCYAMALRLLKKFEEALSSVNHSLDLSPDAVDALHERGKILISLNKYEEALTDMNRIVELGFIDNGINGSDIFYDRGRTLTMLEKYHEALADLEMAVNLRPENAEAWFERGKALAALDQKEKALACFDRAAELKPDDLLVAFSQSLIHGHMKQFDAAISYIRYALEIAKKLGAPIEISDNFQYLQQQFEIGRNATARRTALQSLQQFLTAHTENRRAEARQLWFLTVEAGKEIDVWQQHATQILTDVASGNFEMVRELITSSHTEAIFFPLLRTIDYLSSGDEALIQKLSPEMRGIVEEIVAKLRPVSEKPNVAT